MSQEISRSTRTFRESVVVVINSSLRQQNLSVCQAKSGGSRLTSYWDVVDVYECTTVAHEYCPDLQFLARPYPSHSPSFRSLNLVRIHPRPRGNCYHHLATSSCNYPTTRSCILVRIIIATGVRVLELGSQCTMLDLGHHVARYQLGPLRLMVYWYMMQVKRRTYQLLHPFCAVCSAWLFASDGQISAAAFCLSRICRASPKEA